MVEDKNKNILYCSNCGSPNLKFYDGSLGYEAVVCKDCKNHHTDNRPLLTRSQIETIRDNANKVR